MFQLFKTTKPYGTGLGLPIVGQIISEHRGTVDYVTELGKGTAFIVSLPLSAIGVRLLQLSHKRSEIQTGRIRCNQVLETRVTTFRLELHTATRCGMALRNRQEFQRSQLTELANTDFESWAKESFEIATKIAYRNGGRIGIPKGGAMDCTMVAAAPVLPVGYVVSASRIADRRMILAGYRLADLLTRLLKL